MTNVFVGACTYRHQIIPPAQTLCVTPEKTKLPSSCQKLWGKQTLGGSSVITGYQTCTRLKSFIQYGSKWALEWKVYVKDLANHLLSCIVSLGVLYCVDRGSVQTAADVQDTHKPTAQWPLQWHHLKVNVLLPCPVSLLSSFTPSSCLFTLWQRNSPCRQVL